MKRFMVWCLPLLIIAGCASQNVKISHDRAAGLSGLKTFTWLQTGAGPGEDVRVNNAAVIGFVEHAVEKNLEAKGYRKSAGQGADFVLTWFGAIETKVRTESIEKYYSSYGYGAVYRGLPVESGKAGAGKEYEEGTIIIDVLDQENKMLLWRGTSSEKLRGKKDEEGAQRYIDQLVSRILRKFPEAAR
jgi:hypothetical protein